MKAFNRTAIFVAVAACFPFSGAFADDEVEALINPDKTEVTAKIPYLDKVNPLYRQYTGLNHQGINGNLDADIVRRSEAGAWMKLDARDLGLPTQELGVSYDKQGDWSVGLNYNQIPRYAPYEVQTAVSGVGSMTLQQPNVNLLNGTVPALSNVTLSTERDITTLTASKYLMDGLKLGFSFKNEEKTGIQMGSARGAASLSTAGVPQNPFAQNLFAPMPVDLQHQQIEGTLEYVTPVYQITAGYYGSFLTNRDPGLNVFPGTNTRPFNPTTGMTIALAPDSQSQQVYVNGAYNFSKNTRATMKVAYSEGEQRDAFATSAATVNTLPVNAGIGPHLGAKVQTTEVYASLMSRVTKDLKLSGSWRYEDKDDNTPRKYFYAAANSLEGFYNGESRTISHGRFDADYNLGRGYSLTAGVDYSEKKLKQSSVGVLRQSVDETTGRLALRKLMGESVSGTATYTHSDRQGSGWEDPTAPIFPVYLADRKRDSLKGLIDWAAANHLDFQFAYEGYFDRFDRSETGLDKGDGQIFSFDASYVMNDAWKGHTWYSKQTGNSKQFAFGQYCTAATTLTCTPSAIGIPFARGLMLAWNAELESNSDQFGLGVDGKIKAFDVGAQYLYSYDTNKQKVNVPFGTGAQAPYPGTGVLPDVKYKVHNFRVFGAYPVAKATLVRVDYIYDLRKMDDYTWTNWVYADGTKVFQDPKQTTHIFGVSLTQSF